MPSWQDAKDAGVQLLQGVENTIQLIGADANYEDQNIPLFKASVQQSLETARKVGEFAEDFSVGVGRGFNRALTDPLGPQVTCENIPQYLGATVGGSGGYFTQIVGLFSPIQMGYRAVVNLGKYTWNVISKTGIITRRALGIGESAVEIGLQSKECSQLIANDWACLNGMLRQAMKEKGNFTIGSATIEQANAMGKAWVGDNFKVSKNGVALISSDGMRQYRAPTIKKGGRIQANFQRKFGGQRSREWSSNGHLNIVE